MVNSSWFHDRAGNSAMMWVAASNISFTRCIFSLLNVGEKLGSIFEIIDQNSVVSTLLVYSSSFQDNHAEQNGGILSTRHESRGFALFSDCKFLNNTATMGGIAWTFDFELVFQNCVIEGNSALESGAMLYSTQESRITIINCTVINNEAGDFNWKKLTLSGVPSDINRRTDINWRTELITYLKSACTHAIQPYQLTLSGVPS